MTDNLFIPTKLRVGFVKRAGTYTGNLAYVIYYDAAGKLRKEKSWESWRDKTIDPIDIDNTPSNGFVLNKGVQRDGHGWGTGRSVIRVHDSREFEFEITVDNLIGILAHSDVSKRDIVQECVYAWKGSELVLLPTNSEAYQASVVYTDKQSQKLGTKALVQGYAYSRKTDTDIYLYIGKRDWYHDPYSRYRDGRLQIQTKKQVKHVFQNVSTGEFTTMNPPQLAGIVSTSIPDNYPFIVSDFLDSVDGSLVNKIEVRRTTVDELVAESKWGTTLYRFDGTYLYSWNAHFGYRSEEWVDGQKTTDQIIYNLSTIWKVTPHELDTTAIATERIERPYSQTHYRWQYVQVPVTEYETERRWFEANVKPAVQNIDGKYTGRQWLAAIIAAGYGVLVYSTANSNQFFNLNHKKI